MTRPGPGELVQHALTAAISIIAAGIGFFMLESRHHVTRDELQQLLATSRADLQRHLDETGPMIRQMDEERGRVEARLKAIEDRLIENTLLLREVTRAAGGAR